MQRCDSEASICSLAFLALVEDREVDVVGLRENESKWRKPDVGMSAVQIVGCSEIAWLCTVDG